MREIKFRAYYIPEKTWFNWTDMMREFSHYDKPFETTDEWKVMQYTGLKDKNGVEIYEGDIVSLDGSITGAQGLNPGFLFTDDDKVEIAWDEDIAAWSLAGKLDRTDRVEVTYRNHAIQLIQQGVCEVIGNIYENPELLEATDPQQSTKGSKRTTDLAQASPITPDNVIKEQME